MAANTAKQIHYIIVVHGIGEQRKNETVMPVIRQFAAARHNNPRQAGLLSLGCLTSLSTAHDWIELEGIPAEPDPKLHGAVWQPQAASQGDNLRFIDIAWSDIARDQHPVVSETVKKWTDDLIDRLELRRQNGQLAVEWILYVLQNMQDGILFLQTILSLRLPKLSDVVFNDFLGDVELYGNFPHTRGQAVRLFHEKMAALHRNHVSEFGQQSNPPEPRYTIVAHSLGTVLSLDAITYAYANRANDFWPGYGNANNPPAVEWVNNLCSFVTLGSPIDKYLALWTENYRHLNNAGWLDATFNKGRSTKIRHFNYSDEQDPVGHELNILTSTPVWQHLFEMGEDVVFARYPVMGVAHVDYWNDYDLFHRILDVAVDNRDEVLDSPQNPPVRQKPTGHYAEWFEVCTYVKGLALSYVAIPFIGWLIASMALSKTVGAGFSLFWLLVFIAAIYLTHKVMKLVIMWRLMLDISRSKKSPMEEKRWRVALIRVFEAIVYGTPVLWTVLLLLCVSAKKSLGLLSFISIPYPTMLVLLGLAALVSIDIAVLYGRTHRRRSALKNSLAHNFQDYL